MTIANNISAQVPLKPLYEVFTSATCAPCVPFNTQLDSLLYVNPSNYSLIKYQVNFPGGGDPYYISENGIRFNYYDINFAPTMKINNVNTTLDEITQETYDSFVSQMTFLQIEIPEARIDENNIINITAKISALADYPAGLKAHVAIIEKKTTNNFASNGEEEFKHVNLKMLPNGTGTTLGEMSSGDQETLTFSYDMSTTFMETPNDLILVIFVQDDSDMSIIQSENKDIEGTFEVHDLIFNISDINAAPIHEAKIYVDAYGPKESDINGTATYEDVLGRNTSYTVSYPTLVTVEGEINLEDEIHVENITLLDGDYFVYEDFNGQLPVNWTTYTSGGEGFDDVIWLNNSVSFSSLIGASTPLYLTSQIYDLSQNSSGMIIYNLQGLIGVPIIGFGTISDQDDFGTITELIEHTVPSAPITYTHNISDLDLPLEAVQFYWFLKPTGSVFASLNYFIITNGVLSNQEIEVLKKVIISPNPALENTTISSDQSIHKIELFNYLGQMVKQVTNDSSNSVTIDLAGLHNGAYIAVIHTDLGTVAKQLIVE